MSGAQLPFEKVKRKVIVRKKAETSDRFGCYPDKRDADFLISYGIVNIDKPSGPTSHQVSSYAKKIVGAKKAGHSGTLDPNVTGVLPIAFDNATRIVQLLLTAGKEYVGLMHLHKDVEKHKLVKTMNSFVGRIKQMPPVKSSIKRQLRERNVYYIEIMEIDVRDVLFKVGCQAGTYIRKLVYDIGKKLGTGANMLELRRTKAGPFDEKTLVTLQDLKDAYHYYKKEGNDAYLRHCIQPIENAVAHLPKIWVVDTAVNSICHGSNLKLPGISKLHDSINKDDFVAIMTLKDELIAYGIARMSSKDMLAEKGVAVKTDKVFMKPGTYPHISK
jgi:H/ACA ribonucleoprotein complex subunit 4